MDYAIFPLSPDQLRFDLLQLLRGHGETECLLVCILANCRVIGANNLLCRLAQKGGSLLGHNLPIPSCCEQVQGMILNGMLGRTERLTSRLTLKTPVSLASQRHPTTGFLAFSLFASGVLSCGSISFHCWAKSTRSWLRVFSASTTSFLSPITWPSLTKKPFQSACSEP